MSCSRPLTSPACARPGCRRSEAVPAPPPMTGSLGHVAAWNRSPTGWVPSLFSGVFSPISEEFRPDFRGAESRMILAQLSDPHIVAAGKLFRCPMQAPRRMPSGPGSSSTRRHIWRTLRTRLACSLCRRRASSKCELPHTPRPIPERCSLSVGGRAVPSAKRRFPRGDRGRGGNMIAGNHEDRHRQRCQQMAQLFSP